MIDKLNKLREEQEEVLKELCENLNPEDLKLFCRYLELDNKIDSLILFERLENSINCKGVKA